MAFLEIPIRFRFLRVPAVWEIRTVSNVRTRMERELAFARVENFKRNEMDKSEESLDKELDLFKVSELDGWKCRDEFFGLSRDSDSLLQFLSKVGVWHWMKGELSDHWSEEVMQHYRQGHPVPIDVEGLWVFRDALKSALVDHATFKEMYASRIPRPETGLEMALAERDGIEFPLRFELREVASGLVTVNDAHTMLLATVFADIIRGIRFKTCKRKDCAKPFAVESEHKRKYCSQYCGHLESVRRNAAERRAQKRREMREARKLKRG